MKFLCLYLFCGVVGASPVLSPDDINSLVAGDPSAFTQALDLLEGQNLRHFYLRGKIPGLRRLVPNVFHVVARLSPAEVTRLFLRAAIQDPILGFFLVAGIDQGEPDYYIPLSLVLELIHAKPEASRVLRALNRVLRAYESIKSVDLPALNRFDERIFVRLGRMLGQYPQGNQDELARLMRVNNKYLDRDLTARLRQTFVRANHLRCVMALSV